MIYETSCPSTEVFLLRVGYLEMKCRPSKIVAADANFFDLEGLWCPETQIPVLRR